MFIVSARADAQGRDHLDRTIGTAVASLADRFHVWLINSPVNAAAAVSYWQSHDWSEIEVFGAHLTNELRAELAVVGATYFEMTATGFVCRREPPQ